jgi:hypothetical protein
MVQLKAAGLPTEKKRNAVNQITDRIKIKLGTRR